MRYGQGTLVMIVDMAWKITNGMDATVMEQCRDGFMMKSKEFCAVVCYGRHALLFLRKAFS